MKKIKQYVMKNTTVWSFLCSSLVVVPTAFSAAGLVIGGNGIVIPKELSEGNNCQALAGTDAKDILARGICHAHGSNDVQADAAIVDLQKSQNMGLQASAKNAAVFFEGLMHCSKLSTYPDVSKGDAKLDTIAQFCAHRSMAFDSFAAVRWREFGISYGDPTANLKQELETMIACETSYLSRGENSFDTICGTAQVALHDSNLQSVIKAAEPVFARYLRGKDEALGGIISRKITTTADSVERSKKKLADLKLSTAEANSKYEKLQSTFDKESGEISSIYESYRGYVVDTQKVLDDYDDAIRGMWQYDGKSKLDTYKRSLELLTKKYEELTKKESNTAVPVSERIKNALAKVKDKEAVQIKSEANAQKLCAIYFCEFAIDDRLEKLKSICQSNKDLIGICKDNGTEAAVQYCSDQKFDQRFRVIGLKGSALIESCRDKYLKHKTWDGQRQDI